jgi:hypothetical protein
MVIDSVHPGDEIDLTVAIASLRAKDYLLFPSTFPEHLVLSRAKEYGIYCVSVDTLENSIAPLLDSAVSFFHPELNRAQSEIKTLLAEYDELTQTIAEFEKRAKVYIEGKASFLETAKKRLAFLEDVLLFLNNEINHGKFATQAELKKKIEQILNSFEEFPSSDEMGGAMEELFVEISDGISWTETELERNKKKTKTILLREFHRHINHEEYTEEDAQNWHRVRNLWKEKDHLLLAAHIICHEAKNGTDDETELLGIFERFDAEVDKLTYTLKVREGLKNRIRNIEASQIYRAAMRGERWLESVSRELDKQIDAIKPRLKQLEAEIRNLTL